jgi:hypothetical protein
VQETEPAVKSPRATRSSTKKIPVSRSTKWSKKSKEADVFLETHESTDSPHDVSNYPLLIFLACFVYLRVPSLPGIDEEICRLGH